MYYIGVQIPYGKGQIFGGNGRRSVTYKARFKNIGFGIKT